MKCLAPILWLSVVLRLCVSHAMAQEVVRACGAVSVAVPLAEAIPILKAERGVDLVLRVSGGTGMGLDALGDKGANIALCSRELTPVDRADFPAVQFHDIPIGMQIIAMAVSRDVWMSGIHALNASQARGIYEGRITNWKQVGGPDLAIKAFMYDPGRGPWEVLVHWLYKEIKMAPVWRGAKVKEFTETCNMLEFTAGSFSLIPPRFADGRNVFALAVQREDSASPVEPTLENVLKDKYPLSRPLLLVTNDKPTGAVKVVVDFMTSERGQALVRRFGYVTLAEVNAARPEQ